MSHHVIWNADSIEELQRIMDTSDDPEGIIAAVAKIGQILATHPTQAGESRDLGARIMFEHPLVVRFRFENRLKTVVVYEIGAMRQ